MLCHTLCAACHLVVQVHARCSYQTYVHAWFMRRSCPGPTCCVAWLQCGAPGICHACHERSGKARQQAVVQDSHYTCLVPRHKDKAVLDHSLLSFAGAFVVPRHKDKAAQSLACQMLSPNGASSAVHVSQSSFWLDCSAWESTTRYQLLAMPSQMLSPLRASSASHLSQSVVWPTCSFCLGKYYPVSASGRAKRGQPCKSSRGRHETCLVHSASMCCPDTRTTQRMFWLFKRCHHLGHLQQTP